MPKLRVNISVSLDGFVAGPNQTLEEPLGRGGEQLHEYALERTRVIESPTGVTHVKYRVGS
jgi:hypothetical protein